MKIDYLANQLEHIPLLAEWYYRMWGYHDLEDTSEKKAERLRGRANYCQVPTYFVAVEDGKLLGSAGLVKIDVTTKPKLTPWLASVIVGEEFRNRGIGSAVVQRVMEEAKALDIETLYLITPDKQNFYARLGWIEMEEIHYRNEWVTMMMVKP